MVFKKASKPNLVDEFAAQCLRIEGRFNLSPDLCITEANCAAIAGSFEPKVLKRLRYEFQSKIPLIQLIGDNNKKILNYHPKKIHQFSKQIKSYASGIGISISDIMTLNNTNTIKNKFQSSIFHDYNLIVHVYTIRADKIPKEFNSIDSLLKRILIDFKVDGIFTDHCDLALKYVHNKNYFFTSETNKKEKI